MSQTLLSFVISLFIGLLIGLEREHSHQEGAQPIGIRVFILFALLGTLAASLDKFALTMAISIFVFIIILLGYYRLTNVIGKRVNIGITTEISACIVFCIGYMIPTAPLVAIILSALVLLVLVERQRLHVLARKKFKAHTIETVIIFLIFILGILPILPNRTIDPWGLFNPHYFGILTVTIALIQFLGIVFIHLFGERFGVAMTGLLGGFVSSTIVFANLPVILKAHPKCRFAIIASAVLANLAMLIEILVIIFVASPSLLLMVIKPILVMCIVSVIFTYFLFRFEKSKKHKESLVENPFRWVTIFRTAFYMAFILVVIAIAKSFVGSEGMLILSFLSGLFEIHGVTLATALLYLDHHLTSTATINVLYVAILGGFISKFFLLWGFTPKKFALETSAFLLFILISGSLTFWLVY